MSLILSTLIVIVVTILAVVVDFTRFGLQLENLQFFVDFPSGLVVLLPAISLLAGASAGGDFWRGLRRLFCKGGGGPEKNRRREFRRSFSDKIYSMEG